MSNYLTLTILGDNQTDLIDKLAQVVAGCKCNIVESRMAALGESCAAMMLVQGNWNTISKLETQLGKFARTQQVNIHHERTQIPPEQSNLRPYAVDISALDQAGILQHVAGFFAGRNIPLLEITIRSYKAAHIGTAMSTVNLVIGVAASVHIGMLREEFMEFCDDFNWDAVMEPVKQ